MNILNTIPSELETIVEERGGDFFDEYENEEAVEQAKELGWIATLEESFGGEGMGDQRYSVYSFEKDGNVVYIKFDGWYDSNNGSEYNECFAVQPQEKTITVYEKI